jgi:hypothetical protein
VQTRLLSFFPSMGSPATGLHRWVEAEAVFTAVNDFVDDLRSTTV